MSVSELDAFRAELLRQKIIFEAELRRQREQYEERISIISQELADREADCRNLQSVVTILGKKLDILSEQFHQQFQHRANTPRRAATPTRLTERDNATHELKELRVSMRSNSARRASPLISIRNSEQLSFNRVPSLTAISKSSRTSSPACPSTVHPHRPLLTSSINSSSSLSGISNISGNSNNSNSNNINSIDNTTYTSPLTTKAAVANGLNVNNERSARYRERINGRQVEKHELAAQRVCSANSNNDEW